MKKVQKLLFLCLLIQNSGVFSSSNNTVSTVSQDNNSLEKSLSKVLLDQKLVNEIKNNLLKALKKSLVNELLPALESATRKVLKHADLGKSDIEKLKSDVKKLNNALKKSSDVDSFRIELQENKFESLDELMSVAMQAAFSGLVQPNSSAVMNKSDSKSGVSDIETQVTNITNSIYSSLKSNLKTFLESLSSELASLDVSDSKNGANGNNS